MYSTMILSERRGKYKLWEKTEVNGREENRKRVKEEDKEVHG